MSNGRAYAELCLASTLWGFGFIATRWAMESLSPIWLQVLRYGIVVALALPFWLLLKKASAARAMRIAAVPGIALGLSLLFQTYGLKYTTITKSGFLTTLYVIIVPIIETLIRKQIPTWRHIFCVLLALVGTALMTGLGASGDSAWNVGDLLTIAAAFCAAVQILSLGRLASQLGSFEFNFFQSLWSGIIPLCLAIGWEPAPHFSSISAISVAGLLFLALGSTLLGFQIQIRAQRVISPSIASFFFLLESPVAAVFAAWFYAERLTPSQWLGAALIFLATGGSIGSGSGAVDALP